MNELKLEATRENLASVFDFVSGELKDCGCAAKIKRQIKLCVEEIYMNIVNYAYDPYTGPAQISVEVISDPIPIRVIISFMDKGKPYDPLAKEDPDTESGLDERPIGGLGIFLVKTSMDGVEYEYKDGHNILTISKELQQV